MCPVDLKRSLQENTHNYVLGPAYLNGYRLGFFRYSRRRQCGVLDVVRSRNSRVYGVLYSLPWRLSALLDRREEGYVHHRVKIHFQDQCFPNTRTYTVVNKLTDEYAPSDWYFDVVMRGALTCGLPESYCWQLFDHMHQLQQQAQLIA